MSIFHRLTNDELQREFTHIGWFAGICPIYYADTGSEGCVLAERNWVPEWYFSMCEGIFGLFCAVMTTLNPDFEPTFPIMLTGVFADAPEPRRPT